jgi:hypothetical protein
MHTLPKIDPEHDALAEKAINETIQKLTDAGVTQFAIGIVLGRASGRLQRSAFPSIGHFTEEDLSHIVASHRDANGMPTSYTRAAHATAEQIDDELTDLEETIAMLQSEAVALLEMRTAKAPNRMN